MEGRKVERREVRQEGQGRKAPRLPTFSLASNLPAFQPSLPALQPSRLPALHASVVVIRIPRPRYFRTWAAAECHEIVANRLNLLLGVAAKVLIERLRIVRPVCGHPRAGQDV